MKEEQEQKPKKSVKKLNAKMSYWNWPLKVLFLTFALSMLFSICSEFLLSGTGIIICIILIVILILIALIADMIGVAVTACQKEPFRSMASRKVRGAKEALLLLKNAEKVASLCGDVIGDVCGILSGAAGASIVLTFTNPTATQAEQILLASLISSGIASLTIFAKALGKKFSMDKSQSIVLSVGRFLSLFSKQDTRKNKQKNKQIDGEDNNVNSKEGE